MAKSKANTKTSLKAKKTKATLSRSATPRRAAKAPSSRQAKAPNDKIRYAVIGLGNIAQVAVLPAFAHAKKNSELVALISDDAKKRQQLAKRYKIPHTYSYDQYEECLTSGLVDAVYIALPNALHREYTERAAACGIHVLCEKPLAMTSEDAQAMIEATRQANVKLMTAYRLHFEKANLEAIRVVQSGELGTPRSFESSFTFQVREGNIRLDETLGGGPLYDIGIYCINASRYLFREVPTEVFAFSSPGIDRRFAEVDEMVSAILRYPNGKLASFTCGFSGAPVAFYEVIGTKGALCLEQAYEYTSDMELETLTASGKSKKRTFKKSDQFAPELLYFSDCIQLNKMPEPNGLEGLIDVQIIEALNQSLREGHPVKLNLEGKKEYPDLKQEIRRPAVSHRETIRAPSPSLD